MIIIYYLLFYFNAQQGRAVLKEASARLAETPLAQTRHLKTLRPNRVAETYSEFSRSSPTRTIMTAASASATGKQHPVSTKKPQLTINLDIRRRSAAASQSFSGAAYPGRPLSSSFAETARCPAIRGCVPERAGPRARIHSPSLFASGDSPGGSPEIRACRAEFASLAAPETAEFEPDREDFRILSLFRISLVPRETRHKPARRRELDGSWRRNRDVVGLSIALNEAPNES